MFRLKQNTKDTIRKQYNSNKNITFYFIKELKQPKITDYYKKTFKMKRMESTDKMNKILESKPNERENQNVNNDYYKAKEQYNRKRKRGFITDDYDGRNNENNQCHCNMRDIFFMFTEEMEKNREETKKARFMFQEEINQTRSMFKEEINKTRIMFEKEQEKTRKLFEDEVNKTRNVFKEEQDKTRKLFSEEVKKNRIEMEKMRIVYQQELQKTRKVMEDNAKMYKEEMLNTRLLFKEITENLNNRIVNIENKTDRIDRIENKIKYLDKKNMLIDNRIDGIIENINNSFEKFSIELSHLIKNN